MGRIVSWVGYKTALWLSVRVPEMFQSFREVITMHSSQKGYGSTQHPPSRGMYLINHEMSKSLNRYISKVLIQKIGMHIIRFSTPYPSQRRDLKSMQTFRINAIRVSIALNTNLDWSLKIYFKIKPL